MPLKKKEKKEQLQVYVTEKVMKQLRRSVKKEATTLSSMVEDCIERGLVKYVGGQRKGRDSSTVA